MEPELRPAMPDPHPPQRGWFARAWRKLVGAPRDLRDPSLFHRISLIAFLAWVGLGADGLSSSAYGPDEAFRALGENHYLALALAAATALTVFIISYAYSRIIEHFPFGGGGYVVASRLLGARAGVVSGSALIVDYVLTIAVSVASGVDAIWSFLPLGLQPLKLPVDVAVVLFLVVLNLRGVKESVTALMPIFLVFVVAHLALIVGGIAWHVPQIPGVARGVAQGFRQGLGALGGWGMFLLFARAYSLGGGTYTGIEAVSNGLPIMREPKVETAKRTMVYMAASLAFVAGGILILYLLVHARPVEGKTMNAVLLDDLVGSWRPRGWPIGHLLAMVTLASEGMLLFVAAQTGFIDGPRVMANMAVDSWMPHRFSALSDRFTMKNGVWLMGLAALAALLYTRGDVDALVVMYSINVFLTFSLSNLGMSRYWLKAETRRAHPDWRRHLSVHLAGLVLCAGILAITLVEKFGEGGWLTVVFTAGLVAVCFAIHRHYANTRQRLSRLDTILPALPALMRSEAPPLEPSRPTAALLVSGFGGLGIHSLLTIQRLFPGYFRNFVFLSVAVIDSASFQGVREVDEVLQRADVALRRYVEIAGKLGLAATAKVSVGTEAVAEAVRLCAEVAREFPRTIFFSGKLVFNEERWWDRLLHNETAYAIQSRLQFAGLPMVVLPVRVIE